MRPRPAGPVANEPIDHPAADRVGARCDQDHAAHSDRLLDGGSVEDHGSHHAEGPLEVRLRARPAVDEPHAVRGCDGDRAHPRGPRHSAVGNPGPLDGAILPDRSESSHLLSIRSDSVNVEGRLESGQGPAGTPLPPARRDAALLPRHPEHGGVRQRPRGPPMDRGANVDLLGCDASQDHGAQQRTHSSGADRSAAHQQIATGIADSRMDHPIRGRDQPLGPSANDVGAAGKASSIVHGAISGPSVGLGPREITSRKQLLEQLGGGAGGRRRAVAHLHAESSEIERAPQWHKRPRRSRSGNINRTAYEEGSAHSHHATASHTEPFIIHRALPGHGQPGAAPNGDEGNRCLRGGEDRPRGEGAGLEASIGPASNEDGKMHYPDGIIGLNALASTGMEAEAAGPSGLAAVAAARARGGGGPNSAGAHAAATWARHAVARRGADGEACRLSAG